MSKITQSIGVALAVVLVSAWLGSAAFAAILVSVETDQDAYWRAEPITYSVTASNTDPFDVTLHFASSIQAQSIVDGAFSFPTIGMPVLTAQVIPANGSYTWTIDHPWSEYELDIGPHSVRGIVVGVGQSDPVQFEIIPRPPIPDAVWIDFDTLPDGSPNSGSVAPELAYEAWGVIFTKIGEGRVSFAESDGNVFVANGSTSYPPGFNIVANLSEPVYHASVHVSTALGLTVTMMALDENGALLDSVTSPAIESFGGFIGPIELWSDQPIARLEWWPSQENASVRIDDLHLETPEPSSLLGLSIGTLLLVRLRRHRCRDERERSRQG